MAFLLKWEKAKSLYRKSRQLKKSEEFFYVMAVANSKKAPNALRIATKLRLKPSITKDTKGRLFTVRVEVEEPIAYELFTLGWNLVHGGIKTKQVVPSPKEMRPPEDMGSSVHTIIGGLPNLGKRR